MVSSTDFISIDNADLHIVSDEVNDNEANYDPDDNAPAGLDSLVTLDRKWLYFIIEGPDLLAWIEKARTDVPLHQAAVDDGGMPDVIANIQRDLDISKLAALCSEQRELSRHWLDRIHAWQNYRHVEVFKDVTLEHLMVKTPNAVIGVLCFSEVLKHVPQDVIEPAKVFAIPGVDPHRE